MSVTDLLKALTVLAPLVEQVVLYLRGGSEPAFFASLPPVLKSQVALNAKIARERGL